MPGWSRWTGSKPHPLNSNVMPDDLREKLRAHIKRTGRYPYVIVRPHPGDPGRFQVLDGHHRLAILRELGHTEARCDVWDVDDREAKLLLATLNRSQGQDLPIKRAQLIHDLLGEMSLDDLAGLLPETDKQLEELHALLEFPAEEIAASWKRRPRPPSGSCPGSCRSWSPRSRRI